jgi:hypothetical protein|nr:MAG TPA: hypothetical protein [Caudoviricetes sp.]
MENITKLAIELGLNDRVSRPSLEKAEETIHGKMFDLPSIAKYTGISIYRLKNLSSGRTPLKSLPDKDLQKIATFNDLCSIFDKLAEKIQ